jgi:hypothetical protein
MPWAALQKAHRAIQAKVSLDLVARYQRDSVVLSQR